MSNQTSSKIVRPALLLGCVALAIGVLSWAGVFNSSLERNATVQGTVTIDGELANRGTVTFHPVKGGPVAVGQIHSDGSYSLSVGRGMEHKPDKNTVFPGEHVVTVMVFGLPDMESETNEGGPPLAGPRLVAEKYTSKETSGLMFNVKPGRNLFVLAIDGATSDQMAEEAVLETSATKEISADGEEATSEQGDTTGQKEATSDTSDVISPAEEEASK